MLARADARRARRLKAALNIQKNMRMLKARTQYLETRAAALTIQSAWRGHLARSVASEIRYVAWLLYVRVCGYCAMLIRKPCTYFYCYSTTARCPGPPLLLHAQDFCTTA